MGMFHRFPHTMAALEAMPESFRTGLGHDYDSHGPEGAVGIERSFEPWNRTISCPTCSPRSTASSSALSAGIDVADIGCGAGGAVLLMACRVPEQQVRRLRHLADTRSPCRVPADRGWSRRTFASSTRATSRLPDDGSVRVRHDVRLHPRHDAPVRDDAHDPRLHSRSTARGCSSTSRRGTRSPRTWPRTRWPSLMYGISVLACMSSAMSAPDGAGLGTLGLPASPGRGDGRAPPASTHFRRLDIDHSINAFYEVRPAVDR